MEKFESKILPVLPDAFAPDGSDVIILLGLMGGGWLTLQLDPVKYHMLSHIRRLKRFGTSSPGRGKCG